MMYEAERRAVIDCAREMERRGLVQMSGGNVSARAGGGHILMTPSAMPYDAITPEDIVVLDAGGGVVEGARRPSSDSRALLYIFRRRADIGAVIHTHQPYATALGLVCDRLPANQITVIDELEDDVPVAPFTRSSDEGMGIAAVEYATRAKAVMLKHHGALAFGDTAKKALAAALYLEEACQVYLAALATGLPVPLLTPEQIADESAERGYYGQP